MMMTVILVVVVVAEKYMNNYWSTHHAHRVLVKLLSLQRMLPFPCMQ